MGSSMFDDIMAGALVAKHLFRGASKAYAKAKQVAESEKGQAAQGGASRKDQRSH